MTYFLLASGLILILFGLYLGLKNIDPKFFVAIASGIGLLIAIFGIFGKLYQDIKSGDKQNNILENTILSLEKSVETIKTVTNNLELTQNIDTTTLKLKEQNTLLNDKILNNQHTIDKLRAENITLHERVAHISNNIYNTINGGDSYLSSIIFPNGDGTYRLSAFIEDKEYQSKGIYPLKNVSFNIFIDGQLADGVENKDYNINEEIRLTSVRNPQGIYSLPQNKNFISFGLKIFATNNKYVQLITFKKFTDNKWYMHILQFNDQWGKIVRSDKYWDNYPEELKKMYPEADVNAKKALSESVEVRF